MWSGTSAALGAIEIDGVGAALGSHSHIVIDPGCTKLELNRDLIVGRFADLLDLER